MPEDGSMAKVKLYRLEFGVEEILGVLQVGGSLICFTLELPWKNNQRKISCIPAGEYPLSRAYSPRFDKSMWHVFSVFGRGGILFHIGNTAADTEGCILLGMTNGFMEGKRAVLRSADALKIFEEALRPSDHASLLISELR